jgi:Asp-tRNA(Asn)/Glu-tRNA(Gln) amidotransferase A subunit family amidase
MMRANELSALEAARALAAGTLTSEALVRACLARIEERNNDVLAFTAVDADLAIAQAREADRNATRGALHGIPFAVKDVFDTADYPTAYGSAIYSGNRPKADAGCVAAAREHGAIVIGKVATSEFATQSPSATRNPLDLSRTPGGSSSGSAAAVADFMAPVAFGTQTTGSTIRPAVYCGIVGYKPSFGFFSNAGLKALSPSQDTVGVLARTVADVAFFSLGLHGASAESPPARPSIGVLESAQWQHAKPETIEALERLGQRAAQSGATVTRVRLPAEMEELVALQGRLVAYEARQALAHERIHHWEKMTPRLQARLEGGFDISLADYLDMRRRAALGRLQARTLLDGVDVLLYPAADGEAEIGQHDSGSPRFGALWSLLHLPTVSFPTGRGPAGLPVGVQAIGAFDDDARTLACAEFLSGLAEYAHDRPA